MDKIPVMQTDINLLERLQSVKTDGHIGGYINHDEGLQIIAAYRLAQIESLKNPTPELVEASLKAFHQTRWSAVRNTNDKTINNINAEDSVKAALAAAAPHLFAENANKPPEQDIDIITKERKAIAAWLRGEIETDYTDPEYDIGINLADAIERGAYLQDPSND